MEVSRRSVREGEQARTEIDVSYLSLDPDWNMIDVRQCPKISGRGCKICD
jgi:hypothetical protein